MEPSPDAVSGLLGIIDRYGLPLFVLVAVAFLVWKGVLRFGPDVDRIIKAQAEQLAYVEARRVEERAGRLEAEERVQSNSEALREATQGFREANTIMQALMDREARQRDG